MKKVSIITSATYNHFIDRGAYGCIVVTEDKDHKFDRCLVKSTMPRAELMAVVRALEELQSLFPDEALEIELSSKLSYLTSSFSPGKLRSNVQKGQSLPNYDLWKQIFQLGNKHLWVIIPVNTFMVERCHALAHSIAISCAEHANPVEDCGSRTTKKPKARPVFDFSDLVVNDTKEELQTDSQVKEKSDFAHDNNPMETKKEPTTNADDRGMPIIENNNPPF